MAERYWIYEEVEKKFHIPAPLKLFKKNPDNLGELLRSLRLKKRDKVIITPEFVSQGNKLELITVYHNIPRRIKVAERYASMQYTSPNNTFNPVIFLSNELKDCSTEQEKELWLRIAAPAVDSANILRTEFRQPVQLNNPNLAKNRRKIIKEAHKRNITYQVYSKYQDDRQLWSDLTVKHAFPVTLPQD